MACELRSDTIWIMLMILLVTVALFVLFCVIDFALDTVVRVSKGRR